MSARDREDGSPLKELLPSTTKMEMSASERDGEMRVSQSKKMARKRDSRDSTRRWKASRNETPQTTNKRELMPREQESHKASGQ